VIGALALAVSAGALFNLVQARGRHPMVPLELLLFHAPRRASSMAGR